MAIKESLNPMNRIAFCAGQSLCSAPIYDDDLNAVQLETGAWLCGDCCNKLLSSHPELEDADSIGRKGNCGAKRKTRKSVYCPILSGGFYTKPA